MLEISKIKPMGSQVLVTKNLYEWDDFNDCGIMIHQRGDIKDYQTVVSVGSDVKGLKPGDVVAINFFKYAVFKEDHNSLKVAERDNTIIGLRLNEVEMVDAEGKPITRFIIDFRDIKYILEKFKETTYSKNTNKIKIDQPKKQLILPDTKIKM